MKKYFFFIIGFVLLFNFELFSQNKTAQKPLPEILKYLSLEEIKADEAFLASDELEGREMGERGQKIASLYVKTQFEMIGLKPVNGSYYQKFKVLKTHSPKNSSFIVINGKDKEFSAELKKDFYPVNTGVTVDEISGNVVFAGYGITSPQDNYDDYKDIDVNGKVVLILANAPQENKLNSPFSGVNAARYRQYNIKLENALKHGAIGVLYLYEVGRRTLNAYIKSYGSLLDRPNYKMYKKSDEDKSIPLINITKELVNKILENSGKTIDKLTNSIDSNLVPKSFEIPNATVSIKPDIRREIMEVENTVGLLEGSDPILKKEIIVFSAHIDHIGMTKDGKVFNGADDDASGTVGILNMAKMFVKSKKPTLRSLLFLAVTGEEKGLFGSSYYSDNPLFPFDKTYLDLNIDMIGRTDEDYNKKGIKDYIYIIGPKIMGGDLLKLSAQANDESAKLTLDYLYDDVKDPNIFYKRSDHYNFAKHKIPAIFYFGGEHKDYHKVTDKIDRIDFDLLYKRLQLIGYTGWKFANYKNTLKTERAFP